MGHGEWGDEETQVVDSSNEDDAGARERGQTYLVVLSGNRIGEVVKVAPGLSVGRGAQATFRVADMGASRVHIRFEIDEDQRVRVTDLESRNGTYVNGQKIFSTILEDGDKIRIGTTTILKFSYTDKLEEEFQQQLYDSTIRDPLTRLYNRRHLLSQLEAEFSFSARHGTPFALIMLDIDHFKQVNDTHGHQIGDEVLVTFSVLLKRSLRTEDMPCRYGGEEFAVLCRGLSSEVAQRVASRLLRAVENAELVSHLPAVKVTVSAGVAALPAAELTTPAQLIEAADQALYSAKRTGRNRVCAHEPAKK
jgi:diguanylate cyclase (GGDEF)-like protein